MCIERSSSTAMIRSKSIKVFDLSNFYTIFKISTLLFLIIFFSSYAFSATCNDTCFNASVTKIIDGDTFEISTLGKRKTIRLWGIDTPEWDQPYSGKAKKFLKDNLLKKQLIVQPLNYDEFGRLVATVFLKDDNFNQLLIEKGLAWVHIYYCNEEICNSWKMLEKNARNKRIGLWRQSDPIPPWQWKQKK